MSTLEIGCPNCGSPSIEKDRTGYCCSNCGTYLQIITVTAPKKKSKLKKKVNQRTKYGKINFVVGSVRRLGPFTLNRNIGIVYQRWQVFKFHAFRQIQKGDKIVKADVYGYLFADPFSGKINDIQFCDFGQFPLSHNIGNNLERECVRIINDNAVEDRPPTIFKQICSTIPPMVPEQKIYRAALNYLTKNLTVKKRYSVRPKGSDSRYRQATFTFKKNDILEFDSIGVFAVPLFHLTYTHPCSNKSYKRDYLGYSGELILDELRCSEGNSSNCLAIPNNVCADCGNLVCNVHAKKCEVCGKLLCKDCAVSKGWITKHYFCSTCAQLKQN
jgi:transcription initiation factor TFIIIB Brf1 subunit/transcription initiation factor TFIIB